MDPVNVLGGESAGRIPHVSPASPASQALVSRPASGVHNLPVVQCPACGAVEPAAYIGNRSREVVVMNRNWFRDDSGHYYCRACFACWNSLHVLGEDAALASSSTAGHVLPAGGVLRQMEPYAMLGIRTPWLIEGKERRWRYLAGVQRAADARSTVAATGSHAAQRAGDRMRDAEIAAEALGLPSDVREAIAFHLAVLAARVPYLRRLAGARNEAYTLATVDLVCEHFHVPALHVIEALRFADGSTVDQKEFDRARSALGAWFHEHLWRDSHQ